MDIDGRCLPPHPPYGRPLPEGRGDSGKCLRQTGMLPHRPKAVPLAPPGEGARRAGEGVAGPARAEILFVILVLLILALGKKQLRESVRREDQIRGGLPSALAPTEPTDTGFFA